MKIQGFIVVEKTLIFEITDFLFYKITTGKLLCLPCQLPKVSTSIILFAYSYRSTFMNHQQKKPARYKAFVNTLKKALLSGEPTEPDEMTLMTTSTRSKIIYYNNTVN